MLNPRSNVPVALMFAGAFLLGACGNDVESAWDDDDGDRTVAEMESEEEAVEPSEEPPAEAAPESSPDPQETSRGEPQRSPSPSVERTDPDPQPPLPEVREEPAIPVGTSVSLTVESTLSTQNSEVGDEFYALVGEEVIGDDGMVLIPQGAQVRGQVVESRRSDSADEDAVLAVQFETLLMEGREYPIQATVIETQLERSAADSGTRTATKVATGTAAGAVVGRILGGDARSTIQGAAAGAVAGTAVALATRDGNAVLREGSVVVIRLDERVPLVAQR